MFNYSAMNSVVPNNLAKSTLFLAISANFLSFAIALFRLATAPLESPSFIQIIAFKYASEPQALQTFVHLARAFFAALRLPLQTWATAKLYPLRPLTAAV